MTAYDAGLRLEPCTMLADIDILDDTPPLYTVRCVCPSKNDTSQLYTGSGRSSSAILVRSMEWRMVSNAFEKSKEMTTTKVCSILVTVRRSDIMAAVVESVSRKANWSEKERCGGGFRKAGYRNDRTMARSISLVSTGVTEISRMSAGCWGDGTLGIGRIQASFHRQGTVDVDSERLKRYVKW